MKNQNIKFIDASLTGAFYFAGPDGEIFHIHAKSFGHAVAASKKMPFQVFPCTPIIPVYIY